MWGGEVTVVPEDSFPDPIPLRRPQQQSEDDGGVDDQGVVLLVLLAHFRLRIRRTASTGESPLTCSGSHLPRNCRQLTLLSGLRLSGARS